jgi:hypothetical protein
MEFNNDFISLPPLPPLPRPRLLRSTNANTYNLPTVMPYSNSKSKISIVKKALLNTTLFLYVT